MRSRARAWVSFEVVENAGFLGSFWGLLVKWYSVDYRWSRKRLVFSSDFDGGRSAKRSVKNGCCITRGSGAGKYE